MNKFAYDTLGTSRELEAAGMERRQAEAVAIAIAQQQGDLATKSDLKLLRVEIKSDIGKVESRISKVESRISNIESRISKVESDITEIRSDMKAQFRWVISMQVVVILAVFAHAFANGS